MQSQSGTGRKKFQKIIFSTAAAKPKAATKAKKVEFDEDLSDYMSDYEPDEDLSDYMSEEDEISVDTAASASRRTSGRARPSVNNASMANNSDCDEDTSDD
eukprot:COSAG05_NODE_660_length_8054_cov_3.180264_3_plen_101_part_00